MKDEGVPIVRGNTRIVVSVRNVRLVNIVYIECSVIVAMSLMTRERSSLAVLFRSSYITRGG